MKSGSSIRAVWASLGCLALAACATTDPGVEIAETAVETNLSDTERLAVALVDADDAFARGDKARLADALRRFDSLGGKPLGASDPELERWRRAANQAPPMRGRSLGPGYRSGQLSPGRSEQLEQVFLSGKRASVALSAPSGARLKLEVQDRRDEAVCGKEGNPNHCQWVPLFTDRYRITIVNPGQTAVRYFLVVG